MTQISLCMITKNEETFLDDCLESVKDLVSEIIIVDTGSTDNTKEIAKEHGAKVFDYEWNDDFAKARNESISKATKEWILVLDADEIINPTDVQKLKKEMQQSDADAFVFTRRNYAEHTSIDNWTPVLPEEKQAFQKIKDCSGYYQTKLIRLFRNNSAIKFKGIVHEVIEPSIKEHGMKKAAVSVPLHHFAYLNETASKQKLEYYLSLCKKKVEQEKENPQACFELGVNYKELGSPQQAIESFQKAIAGDKNYVPAYLEFAQILKQNKQYRNAAKIYQLILDSSSNVSSAFFGLGMCNYYLGNLEEAEKNLKRCVELHPKHPQALTNLGALYEKRGKFEQAAEALEKSIGLYDKNPKPYLNLGIVNEKLGAVSKAINAYSKAVQYNHPRKEQILRKIQELQSQL